MEAGDHEAAQDAYERVLPRVVALTDQGHHDEALQVLDRLLRSESHRDHDGWLRRSVVAHRALILADAGRDEDALSEWNTRAAMGFSDPSSRVEHALGVAVLLTRLQRAAEAITLLRTALSELPLTHIGSALGLLGRLAEAYAASGAKLPDSYRPLIRSVAAYHDVPLAHSDDVGALVAKLVETVRARQ